MSSFENDMKDVFDDVEFQPSEKVWAGIASAITPKKKKGIFFMWQTYGVAAGLILATTFGFLLSDGFFSDKSESAQKEFTADNEKLKKENNELNTLKNDSTNRENNLDKDFTAANSLKAGGDSTYKVSSSDADNKRNLSGVKDPLQNSTLVASVVDKSQEANNEKVKSKIDLIRNKNLITKEAEASRIVVSAEEKGGDVKNPELDVLVASPEPILLQASTEKTLNTDSIINSNAAALEVQSVLAVNRERSLSGSFGNNVLNISSGLGSSDIAGTAELRDANTATFLNATVDNTEGEALGAISAGIGASFDVSKRLIMNLGLRYSEFKFRNSSNAYSVEDGASLPIYIPFGFNSENVFFIGDYNIENTIQSLFIQSTLGYKIATLGKFDFSFQLGVGIDYFLAYKVKGDLNFLETRKANPSESELLNRTNFSGVSGFSVNYRLNPKLGLSADFNYRQFFLNGGLAASSPSSAFGFGLSINYFLNKKEE
ncbi:hypothetical protein [Roseivirga sp.]|uniref:hypothetical protein n=1 Tax=Roseivirga sp. TaxID=1964215 RepID=UPI003B8CB888